MRSSQIRHPRTLCQALALGLCISGSALAVPPEGPARLLSASHEEYANAMLSGGPGKDGIPAIDSPRFTDAASADSFLDPQDIVFGVYHQGQARAYPQRILVWHEIVNDSLGEDGLSITYCPLTATAVGFKRGATSLGVSGKLLNSNVVMYDRASDSHWSQIAGVAIDGPAKGRSLEEVRVVWTTWARWQTRHPQTQVLSRTTGALRNYNRDPYGSYLPLQGYYAEPHIMFPLMHQNSRLPDKQMILGFRTEQVAIAVDKMHLSKQSVLHYQHGDEHFLIIADQQLDTGWVYRSDTPIELDPANLRFTAEGPQASVLEGLQAVNAFDAMWFAWYAFYPQTVLIDGSPQP
ncbi:DUF3179 domain-containing protein [Pseudomonas sp. CC6-YY-74]|uniref:DUF3179 domain-containing protein n=1 Tax=Pseudomonas sp. CC6-YY-74 TaxID=1930532 RepID=UPI0009A1E2D8|nr:DUF3179 domain-containing protein [Pseudomonas sp. CC6-YY-74]